MNRQEAYERLTYLTKQASRLQSNPLSYKANVWLNQHIRWMEEQNYLPKVHKNAMGKAA